MCNPHYWYLSPVSNGVSHAVCKLCGETRDFANTIIRPDYNNQRSKVRAPRKKEVKVKGVVKDDQKTVDGWIVDIMHTKSCSYAPRPTRYIGEEGR